MVAMRDERLLMILKEPRVSEKATVIADKLRQFTFVVQTSATKPEIKEAVEIFFKVKVDNVSVINVKGKKKRFKQRIGSRSNWKKAIVTLREGSDIDFMANE